MKYTLSNTSIILNLYKLREILLLLNLLFHSNFNYPFQVYLPQLIAIYLFQSIIAPHHSYSRLSLKLKQNKEDFSIPHHAFSFVRNHKDLA